MSQKAYNINDSIIKDQNSQREKPMEERYYKPEEV